MIFAMHGVVDAPCDDRMTDRNLTARGAFEQFLDRRPSPLVGLEEAMRGAGDALTIDDATRAAADAARVALARGHAVTIFVNPYNVAHRAPHFFTLLDAALDASRVRRAGYGEEIFDLRRAEGKRAYRLRIKQELRRVPTEEERVNIVARVSRDLVGNLVGKLERDLAGNLGCSAPPCPRYLATLSERDLLALQRAGARIENHGWTHAEPAALTTEELCREVERGGQWLQEHLGAPATAYAAPFGEFLSREALERTGVQGWFLLSCEQPAGPIAERVFNRTAVP